MFTPNPDPSASPSSRPAAGPEKSVRAGNRPVSGKKPEAGPSSGQVGGVWQVSSTETVLSNTVTDKDNDEANLTFEVYTTDANGKPKTQVKLDDSEFGVLVSSYVPSGKSAKVTVDYGRLKPGVTYAFHTSAYDGGLYETEWSPWATFKIRDRAVDIKLPEPDKDAATVDLETFQEPQEAKRAVTAPALGRSAPEQGEQCSDAGDNMIGCLEVGRPGELTKKQRAAVDKRLRGAQADADLVAWCSDASQGKDWIKRTEACMKRATPIHARIYSKLPNGQTILVGDGTFASVIQMKLDPQSTDFLQEWTLFPIDFVDFEGKQSEWGPLTLLPEFSCSPNCSTSSPTWRGFPTWTTTGADLHVAVATFKNTVSITDASGISTVQMKWEWSARTPDTIKEIKQGDLGTSTPDLDVRCDKVADPAKPGCVFSAYKPTWVMNFKKYPAAIAHGWLIQSKLPNHPGSKSAGKPMKYLPQAAKNEFNRNPQKNRDVICPKDSSGKSWASAHGNPDATLLPEIKPTDTPSCDEFAYASTYNSAGMPKALKGLNEVGSGDECVQTYATRAKQGEWHLYDDSRRAAPTWKEVCGRSAMSGWINSGSMAGFPGTFAAAGKYHLLDKDEYWVRFPELEHCDASKATVTCTAPKP
ncbi:hypothetical protein [Streptomyces luteocolor]|uniref:hypothetical protein n=1 Tax=Streptomyces luteocolor TaxID=285500 RepID=UPI00114CC1BF|nr:hypothetical protein [Streptomyces luteocolor]